MKYAILFLFVMAVAGISLSETPMVTHPKHYEAQTVAVLDLFNAPKSQPECGIKGTPCFNDLNCCSYTCVKMGTRGTCF